MAESATSIPVARHRVEVGRTVLSVFETDVLGAIHDACRSDQQAILATIVRVAGSAYRRPGTKMRRQ
ncbi:XdhC family protein (plasmid) [Natrinema zhouii]|uniref:XdhC family protein n=1 Tax=Natrinema zhouii TaxID=1710539 RepID=UPI001D00088A|nr:XdhC family protein [Natrinema zhouii]UHQ98598.1 XdhC family protein [Natrinema zhouii]